jgi:hypothetical protein
MACFDDHQRLHVAVPACDWTLEPLIIGRDRCHIPMTSHPQ